MRIPESQLEAVRRIPTPQVVAALRLERSTEEDNKFRCPKHGGTSLHVYADGARCYGGCGGMSNIDLVMETFGHDFRGAVQWLVNEFLAGNTKPGSGKAAHETPEVDLDLQRDVLCTLGSILRLTRRGRQYLRDRGLDPDHVFHKWAVASIDASEWNAVRSYLRKAYTHDELNRAGMRGFGWFSNKTPWPEPVDVLLFPYAGPDSGLYTFRIRSISDCDGPKYMSLRGTGTPPLPFGADFVYGRATGKTVHVVEGEIDALTLLDQYHRLAVAAPGALVVRPDWFDGLRDVGGIVIWGDGDQAGVSFRKRVVEAINQRLSRAWAKTHLIKLAELPSGHDVNSLHVAGRMHEVQVRRVGA